MWPRVGTSNRVAIAHGCLTLRSSGTPTARRAGHRAQGLRPILRSLSSTPRCWRPLSFTLGTANPMPLPNTQLGTSMVKAQNNCKCLRSFAVAATILAGACSCATAANDRGTTVVYRCPGPPVLYTEDISADEAKERGCRGIESAAIELPKKPSFPPPTRRFASVTGSDLASRLEAQAKDRLKDPDSARIRGASLRKTIRKDVQAVCGEINSKNSFGGYVGYTRFFSASNEQVAFERDALHFSELWLEYCK